MEDSKKIIKLVLIVLGQCLLVVTRHRDTIDLLLRKAKEKWKLK